MTRNSAELPNPAVLKNRVWQIVIPYYIRTYELSCHTAIEI